MQARYDDDKKYDLKERSREFGVGFYKEQLNNNSY